MDCAVGFLCATLTNSMYWKVVGTRLTVGVEEGLDVLGVAADLQKNGKSVQETKEKVIIAINRMREESLTWY